MKRREFFALAGGGAVATVLGLKLLPPKGQLTSADIVKAAGWMRDNSYVFPLRNAQMSDIIEKTLEDIARETARKMDMLIRDGVRYMR